MSSPLVSICCITYNHKPYIRKCIEGFLMQQCNFPFEVLIYDDASTDGTQDIIVEYQKKYPEIIKPFLQNENQYSQGVRGINIKFNFSRAKGKYIALCEGDDYWIDSLKLDKQVDFLTRNQEYIICGHWKINIDYKGDRLYNDDDYRNKIKSLSTQCVVFKNIKFSEDFLNFFDSRYFLGENFLYAYLSQYGKSKILPFYGAVYRHNQGGVWSLIGAEKQINLSINAREGMQLFFRDNYQIFEKITVEKSRLFVDYGLLFISQRKRLQALKCLYKANKEMSILGLSALLSKTNIKININFLIKLV